jgi:hypothetical protein
VIIHNRGKLIQLRNKLPDFDQLGLILGLAPLAVQIGTIFCLLLPMTRKGGLLVALGILIIGLIVWQFYKYKIANRSIALTVSDNSKGLYTIHYEDLVIDEVGGSLHVKNIVIIPDTGIYNQMVREKKNPSVLLRLNIPKLDITGVKTPKALLNKELEGGKIEILNPTIEIELSHSSNDTTVDDPGKDISKELLGKLLKIEVDSIHVSGANLVVRNRETQKIAFKVDHVSLLFTDLLIDSLTKNDTSRILFSRQFDMACDEIQLPSKDKNYRLLIEKLGFTSRHNTFHIGSIRLIPQLSETEFAASFPTQKDRYDFMLEGISLVNIDRGSLWHKRLVADNLIIEKSSFKIFRDLSYPRDSISRVGKYPQQQLMQLPIPILIKRAIISRSFIEYKEKNPKSDSAGKVQFFDVHATIDHITNMKDAIASDNKCAVLFRAKFLDEAPVDARLSLLLKAPNGKFSIEGEMGAIGAQSLNPLTEPMGLARMEKGNIEKLHFNLTATDSSSSGTLVILYTGLKISLLKKDKDKNKYDKKGLASLAANIFIKNSNPGGDGKTRTENVHYRRALNKSFFNLIWKSIYTGVKQTAGVK